ncbi:hypothetical protein JMJ35_010385 [Cladonia borealis]|uniref:Uncharacterized protein n=1 Tax=Cladonia borealis TaxID=184061 RepID=A0AA39QQL0_9LECA|nr:hypothetical protein JMJ35_010385 [Cladonia borealis]
MASTKSEQKRSLTDSPEPEPFEYNENSSGRVKVVPYAQTSKFAPGDRVWYRVSGTGPRQGPYIVVQGSSAGQYYLATINDIRILVFDGREVNEGELEEAMI